MSTDAFFAGMTLKIGDGAGSEAFTALEEVTELSGFGEILELIEVTHFGSGGSKEYIAGLADGKEITATCNYVLDAAQQVFVRTNKGITGNLQVEFTNGTDTETYDFAAVYMGWEISPSNSDKNTVTFTFKISGGLTVS
tara:strand:- start:2666 stop:3082 length:417 start_codon:yes stop_codon:yes gene_type:complete